MTSHLLDQNGLLPGKLSRSVPSNYNISRHMQLDCELAEQCVADRVLTLALKGSLNTLHFLTTSSSIIDRDIVP